MICQKCNTENQGDSLFCKKCGASLSEITMKTHKPKWFSRRRNLILGSTILIIGILIMVGILIFNNPVLKFKNNINKNNSVEAMNVYSEKIKGNTEKEKNIKLFLLDDIANTQKLFIEGKIDYSTAKTKLETISNTQLVSDDVSSIENNIDKLNDSKHAFSKAEEYLKNKDLVQALKEYSNVIHDDSNYKKAQKQIINNKEQYKVQVLKNVERYANNKEYDKAIEILTEALSVLPNDKDFTAKNSDYTQAKEDKLIAERKQQMEALKTSQELEVIDTKVVPDYFNVNDQAQVIVKNNTNKVVKNFRIGIAMYDSNGYPLKSGILAGDNETFNGKADAANIQPGQQFGSNNAWNLYTDYGTVSKLSACVISVEYYDGSTWRNDYYNYWEEEYVGKPYK